MVTKAELTVEVLRAAVGLWSVGLLVTFVYGFAAGEPRKFLSATEFEDRYFEVGGYFPSLIGGVYAIVLSVSFQVAAITVAYLAAVFDASFGRGEFIEYSVLIVALSMYVSYLLYLERQRTTRTAKWYQGY